VVQALRRLQQRRRHGLGQHFAVQGVQRGVLLLPGAHGARRFRIGVQPRLHHRAGGGREAAVDVGMQRCFVLQRIRFFDHGLSSFT